MYNIIAESEERRRHRPERQHSNVVDRIFVRVPTIGEQGGGGVYPV